MSLCDLPAELLNEVGEYLVLSYSHGSLASLSQTCRSFRDVSVPLLYRHVIFFKLDREKMIEDEYTPSFLEGQAAPDAWKHTR